MKQTMKNLIWNNLFETMKQIWKMCYENYEKRSNNYEKSYENNVPVDVFRNVHPTSSGF